VPVRVREQEALFPAILHPLHARRYAPRHDSRLDSCLVVAARARREPALTRADSPLRIKASHEAFFVSMTPTTAIPADLLTPLGAYLRLHDPRGGSFLLESVERGRLGRNSFVGSGSQLVSFEEAEALGVTVVGYLGYDHASTLEPTVPRPEEGPPFPESLFVVVDTLVRFDHGAGVAEVLVGDPEQVAERLAEPAEPARPEPARPEPARLSGPLRRFPSQERYEESVCRCQELIRAGDAYQVVPSQRAERPTSASPLALYRALRRVNPSPYLFLLDLGELALVGSSPERLVACENGRASVCPIAGTTTPDEGDAERLLASEKDRAEHTMLVDLGRNDLSRVCRSGTVRVSRFMDVERFSHVSHLVSEVTGELREGVTPYDVLRACFPAGTVTGAPKVRAMQIVAELEGYRRGPYAGAVGYVFADGTMDTCIALRTIVVADGVARIQAGAGVVADSSPEAEHRECLAKLAALEAAIELAEREYA
jgi:anthranilate synthase component 1